jgi:hypothetical protein
MKMKLLVSAALLPVLLPVLVSGCTPASQTQQKWQKLDHKGKAVAIKMGPWHCATDSHSGLTWEVKSWHEDAHYYKATYSFYDPKTKQGMIDGGSCQQGYEWYPCDVSDHIKTLNQQAYCGITSWRLPTFTELQTLTYDKNIKGKLLINPYIFPRTTRSLYMTSTTQVINGELTITMMDFFRQRVEQRKANVVANVRLVSD